MTAEVRAPFRQARIFFLYPATIAAASIASYVSVLRLVGQKDAMADSGNLLVNLGIITAAVFCLRADLKEVPFLECSLHGALASSPAAATVERTRAAQKRG